jgi:hypothetical protein
MPDEKHENLLDIHAARDVFPLSQMVETGLWRALSANAKAVLGPLWNFHRQYPDACRPSRQTLAAAAGVSGGVIHGLVKQPQLRIRPAFPPESGPGLGRSLL